MIYRISQDSEKKFVRGEVAEFRRNREIRS
jgi:hypothetical protein